MKIVMLEPIGISTDHLKELSSVLEGMGHEFRAFDDRNGDTAELIKRSEGANVLIVSNLPLSGDVIRSVSNLKLISVAFTGVDHIDAAACREKGVMVCNTAGYSTHSVAELTFAFILDVLRNILPCDKATRNGGTKAGLMGSDLYGKTLGIVGTGAIGLRVAEIGKAFGCKLLGYSRTVKEEGKALGIEYTSLEDLLSRSDIVTIHTPLTDSTKQLINKKKIALMKPSAILINTARGPIVDSAALAEALNEGRIAGAGVDVFETEPPIPANHPLLNAKNVVLTPHIAFATHEAILRRAAITFDNIKAWLEGNPVNVMMK